MRCDIKMRYVIFLVSACSVSLLHGKMTSEEKNRTLADFSKAPEGEGRILVATSIIEVGVDVPRAGVCVVENAEMFGLSQLHQLRGRLGRTGGGHAKTKVKAKTKANCQTENEEVDSPPPLPRSHCILLYGENLKEDASERLKAVRNTRDGFLLAERDLALRGPGEVLGVRQKGYLDASFKVADLTLQSDLAAEAYHLARRLVDNLHLLPTHPSGAAAVARTGVGGGVEKGMEAGEEVMQGGNNGGSTARDSLAFLLSVCGKAGQLVEGFEPLVALGATDAILEVTKRWAYMEGVGGKWRGEVSTSMKKVKEIPSWKVGGNDSLWVECISLVGAHSDVLDLAPILSLLPVLFFLMRPPTATKSKSIKPVPEKTLAGGGGGGGPELEGRKGEHELNEEIVAGGVGVGGDEGRRSGAVSTVTRSLPVDEGVLIGASRDSRGISGERDGDGDGASTPIGVSFMLGVDLIKEDHTVVIFDLETTGIAAKSNRVIQIAAKVMGSEDPKDRFSCMVDPEGATIPPMIQSLTGITTDLLVANNAQPFREVWPQFTDWLSGLGTGRGGRDRDGDGGQGERDFMGGIVLLAHNARFDHSFMKEELQRADFGRFAMGQTGIVCFVDTLLILRNSNMWRQNPSDWSRPCRPEEFKLEAVYKHLFGVGMVNAHSALGDVIGLESILSAPGISDRWRTIASDNPTYQIPVPSSVEEMQAVLKASPPNGGHGARRYPPQRRR
ncbi:unnamed protein product [Choristocarpus tenellus]